MRIKKQIAGVLAVIMALSYNAGNSVVVHAQENEKAIVTEEVGNTSASQEGGIDFSIIKDNDDLSVTDFVASDINSIEKTCTEDYAVSLVDMVDETEENEAINDKQFI